MAVTNYDVIFSNGGVLEFRGAPCFQGLTWYKDAAKAQKVNISGARIVKIRLYYRHTDLKSPATYRYLSYVFHKFRDDIVTEFVEDALRQRYVEVSVDSPAPIMMGVLIFLRSPEEFSPTVDTFYYLTNRYKNLSPFQMSILFTVSDVLRVVKDNVLLCGRIENHNSNHVVFTRRNLTALSLSSFYNHNWKTDMLPAHEDMDFNGKVQKTFTKMHSFSDERIDTLVPEDFSGHIDDLILPLIRKYQ